MFPPIRRSIVPECLFFKQRKDLVGVTMQSVRQRLGLLERLDETLLKPYARYPVHLEPSQ